MVLLKSASILSVSIRRGVSSFFGVGDRRRSYPREFFTGERDRDRCLILFS